MAGGSVRSPLVGCLPALSTRHDPRPGLCHRHLLKGGEIKPLPALAEAAAAKSYLETAQKLCSGLDTALKSSETATTATSRKINRLWNEVPH